jgi:hypothetical protein
MEEEQESYHEWIRKNFERIREQSFSEQKTIYQENIQRDELDANRQDIMGDDFTMGWEGQDEEEIVVRDLTDF